MNIDIKTGIAINRRILVTIGMLLASFIRLWLWENMVNNPQENSLDSILDDLKLYSTRMEQEYVEEITSKTEQL